MKTYDEAMQGYIKEAKKLLKKKVKELDSKEGDKKLYFSLACPSSYESEYDKVIEFFSMSLDNEIELDMDTFRAYIKDEWAWKDSFTASNSRYLSK